jgi:tripartite-type tricarboxylate transporter receptor subunit TctC
MMKHLLAFLLVCTAFSATSFGAQAVAQEWPTRAVKLYVPFGPGSTPDMVARVIADRLAHKLGQPFVVEDKPGASGNLGTDAVAKAEPDGYTLGISIAGPLAINALLFGKLPYDPAKDFAYVTMVATQPSALAVNARLGVNTVAELVALLKRSPGKYNFGSIGNGSVSHLAMEAIALKSGTQIVHVPYTSSPQAMTALLRGDVEMACLPAIAVTPQLASGAVKILAVSTAARSALLPGIPTLRESGIDVEGRRLERTHCAGGDAGRHCGEDRARGCRGHHRAGRPRQARHAIDGADPRDAGTIPRPHRRRPRPLGAGDPGGEYQDQLSTPQTKVAGACRPP